MSANHSSTDTSFIDRAQFLDVYPVCSQLISDIGREFIRTWTLGQANVFHSHFVARLVDSGVSVEKAEIAWKLVVQEHGKAESKARHGDFKCVSNAGVAVNFVDPVASKEAANFDENIFSFEGGRWVLRFRQQTIYPQDITGIKYLHYLISNPGKTFSPSELYAMNRGEMRCLRGWSKSRMRWRKRNLFPMPI